MRGRHLTATWVADLLQRATRGEVPITLLEANTWDEFFAGNMSFRVGDAEVVFFNDCGDLDYVDHVVRGGKRFDYPRHGDPFHYMTREELRALHARLRTAVPAGR